MGGDGYERIGPGRRVVELLGDRGEWLEGWERGIGRVVEMARWGGVKAGEGLMSL